MGALLPARLAAHLEEAGCLPSLYLPGWLLTAFSSTFPLAFATQLVDAMMTGSVVEPLMKVRCPSVSRGAANRSEDSSAAVCTFKP